MSCGKPVRYKSLIGLFICVWIIYTASGQSLPSSFKQLAPSPEWLQAMESAGIKKETILNSPVDSVHIQTYFMLWLKHMENNAYPFADITLSCDTSKVWKIIYHNGPEILLDTLVVKGDNPPKKKYLEGMEFGASREFFKEDYEKYAWSNIMQPENSGQQRSNLYAEGIDKMSGNPHLPQLFREIFKGAYVPYRDPETLNMFLKEINDFTYDHSEELGNAFEYLLSIMGSQGGAGQFRTPRHIIDMIVEIVDPQKTDSILDPACGTAGFLISSYKHILEKIEIKTATALYPQMTEKG
jgi:hypothetical protein